MFRIDYKKPLIRYNSFNKVWNSLTESQQRELCPTYFEISERIQNLKIDGNNEEQIRNRKFEVSKLEVCYSLSFLWSFFNVCSDTCLRYVHSKYKICNEKGETLAEVETKSDAKKLVMKWYNEGIVKEDLDIIYNGENVPKESLIFIDTNYDHLKSIAESKRTLS